MIGIINYGVGNLQNLMNAFDFINVASKLIHEPNELNDLDKLVFPGVGAFQYAGNRLKESGFWEPLIQQVEYGIPILGICVGMQILFSQSNEGGKHAGLGLIPGEVKCFNTEFKVPQIGWNQVHFNEANPLFEDIDGDSWFYFVHSYVCCPEDRSQMIGQTEYGQTFCSIANKENIWGVQFHPEKSQDAGLQILRNFSKI